MAQVAEADGVPYFAVSAVSGTGMRELMLEVGRMVRQIRTEAAEQMERVERYDMTWEVERKRREHSFTIEREEPGVWRVHGRSVERMVIQTDWDNDEAIIYLQHRFERLGLDTALSKAGARNRRHGAHPGLRPGSSPAWDDDTSDVVAEDASEELIWEDEAEWVGPYEGEACDGRPPAGRALVAGGAPRRRQGGVVHPARGRRQA